MMLRRIQPLHGAFPCDINQIGLPSNMEVYPPFLFSSEDDLDFLILERPLPQLSSTVDTQTALGMARLGGKINKR